MKVYLCVLCGSQNKQQLYPYTALTDWFYNQDAQSSTVTGFFPGTPVLLSQYHSTNAPHSSPSTSCSYQKDKRSKPVNLPISNTLS